MVFFRHTEVLNLAFHKVPFMDPFYSCFSSMICPALPRFSISYFMLMTQIFLSHKSYETLFRLMNSELILVNNWFINNRLSLNVSKTNYINQLILHLSFQLLNFNTLIITKPFDQCTNSTANGLDHFNNM